MSHFTLMILLSLFLSAIGNGYYWILDGDKTTTLIFALMAVICSCTAIIIFEINNSNK